MNIDERLEAIAQSVELLTQGVHEMQSSIAKLAEVAARDGENIRGLARIAEIHERRSTSLE